VKPRPIKSQRAKAPASSRKAHTAGLPRIERVPVIGIAGSAGSLEPLLKILAALPSDLHAAIIFMQHQSRQTPSVLPEVIANAVKPPVQLAIDGMILESGNIFVCPPDAQILVEGKHMRLVQFLEGATPRNTIDAFFSSLAHEVDGCTVGVLLSGLSADGTMGLRLLKEAGGITLVQDPSSARCDVMPRSAEMAGVADLVLKPEAIAGELVQLVRHNTMKSDKAQSKSTKRGPLGNFDEHMPRIFSMLRSASGVDFTYYKQPTIRRRLHRRMVLHRIPTLEKYVQYLLEHPQEITALYQDILIHVTHFFRDPESFEAVIGKIMPRINELHNGDSPIRVWVPGCSTGEEAYSIAIAILEAMRDDMSAIPLQVFATDVSEAAIEHARAGIYPESIVSDVSPERIRRFFTKADGKYRIAKNVRDTCIFARQDLTRDPPFSKLDLIMCRNVLIYLGPVLQKRLINVFHYALKPTGYLMLGAAESVGPHTDLFSIADKRHKIYTKKPATVKSDVTFPATETQSRSDASRPAPTEPRASNSIQNEANRIILARFSPPGVIVDNDLKIVQFRGQTGQFLEPAPGEASFNLLKMAREGLLHALRTTVHEARKNETEARKEDIRFKADGGISDVTLSVTPLGINSADGRHFLILFEKPGGTPPRPKEAALAKKGRPVREETRISHLQQELAASREYLQSIIQDLEAANEELQSANEEILSSNEELQSTNEELDTAKEELQSTNEELNTVNDELQGRNEELMRVNSDLLNLLASVHIAIVMVAADLKIRRFTPMAEKVLNLIPTDVGRPISDIKPNIDCQDLEHLIAESIDTVTIKEREVRDRAGNIYNLRVRPYKNVENRIDGAVLALFEGPVKRELNK
jgi:two-component system CheB/CheR fusion protein